MILFNCKDQCRNLWLITFSEIYLYIYFIILFISFFVLGFFFFFFNFIATLFIYFFIFGCAGSSVRARALSSYGKWGPLLIAVQGPLPIAVRGPPTIAAPPVAGHRLQTRRLSSCGPRAQLVRGTWDPPRPGLEPMSPAPAGRPSTTAPPGKPWGFLFFVFFIWAGDNLVVMGIIYLIVSFY